MRERDSRTRAGEFRSVLGFSFIQLITDVSIDFFCLETLGSLAVLNCLLCAVGHIVCSCSFVVVVDVFRVRRCRCDRYNNAKAYEVQKQTINKVRKRKEGEREL